MSNDNLVTSASRPSVPDRKVARTIATAEQKRQNEAARIELAARETELRIERQRAELALRRERRIAKDQERRARRQARQQTHARAVAKIRRAVPTIGRSVMIVGPILAPMTVAWIGQIGFALNVLHWILAGAVVFAASWELTTAFCGWMYHQARAAGDHGTLFRIATWVSASGAGAMNYWHNCPVVDGNIALSPTPKAVAYGAMSFVGIALWELYCALVHRKALRERGVIPPARPRFGVARWLRYPRITWTAWSLTILDGYSTTESAWAAAVLQITGRRVVVNHAARVDWTTGGQVGRTTLQPPAAPTPQLMGRTTSESTAESTERTTERTTEETSRRSTGRSSRKSGSRSRRRTREELRAQLEAKVAKIAAEDGEIQVKPLAEALRANRKTVRELLDEMGIRPMVRKEATG